MKILLVDDDFFFQKTLSFFLNELGHEVLFAIHGQKALEMIGQNNDIQLIICDLEMPVLKGTDFIMALKELFTIKPAIVVVSANDEGSKLLKDLEISVDYFFKKPLDVNQFGKVLEKIAATA